MNLNTLKRGFTKTNPEKGIRSLSGAYKKEHHDPKEQTIRVKGQYITEDHDKLGKALGFTAFIFSCLCGLILVFCPVILLFPVSSADELRNFLTFSYVILAAALHLLAILADGFRNSNAPWARKSIIIFWSGAAIGFAITILISCIESFL